METDFYILESFVFIKNIFFFYITFIGIKRISQNNLNKRYYSFKGMLKHLGKTLNNENELMNIYLEYKTFFFYQL